jgi:hypothetical protein
VHQREARALLAKSEKKSTAKAAAKTTNKTGETNHVAT